jgi:hypothetical protein
VRRTISIVVGRLLVGVILAACSSSTDGGRASGDAGGALAAGEAGAAATPTDDADAPSSADPSGTGPSAALLSQSCSVGSCPADQTCCSAASDAGATIACTSSCVGATSARLCAADTDCRSGEYCHFGSEFGALVCHRIVEPSADASAE